MPEPQVTVRDLETDHVYVVSEARFKRTPHLWERIGPKPSKSKTTVAQSASAKHAASPAPSKTDDAPASDEQAEVPAEKKEN